MRERLMMVGLLAVAVGMPGMTAQEPPPTQEPPQQQQQQGSGRGGGRAAEPEIRPYERVITRDAVSDQGVFTVHRIKDRLYYEIPKDRLRREFLWVSQIARTTLGAGYGGQAAGNRVVKWERRGDRILLRAVSYDVVADGASPIARAVEAANFNPIVMAFNIEAIGKDDAAVIDVTRLFTSDVPEFSGRTRVGARAFDASRSFVERVVAFPENVNVEAIHTYNQPPPEAGGGRGGPPVPGGGSRSAGAASGHPQRADALQHGAAAGEADAGAALRRARRLLLGAADRLRPRGAPRAPAAVHHALAPREEGPDRRDLGAGEADRLLDRSRDAEEVGPLHEERGGELAGGVRGRGLPQRHRREGGAGPRPGSRVEPGGRALLGDPLAALHDRERVGPARPRPAHRRDPRVGHPVLPQRDEPGPQLVLRAGGAARSQGEDAAAARRADGAPDRVRRGARSRAHARLPAQHEGQLDVSRRARARPRVGEENGSHPHADGLLALQLRRAARGQHRSGRPRARHRPLRQVGDDVGLQADSGRTHARRGEEDARRVGAAAGHHATPPVLHRRIVGGGSGRADGGGRRRGRRRVHDARVEPEAGRRHAADRDDDPSRRAVRRPRGSLRAHARAVGPRNEPCGGDRRRPQFAAEAHRPAGPALHAIGRERQVGAVRFLNDHAFATPEWAVKPEILRRIEPVGVLERVRTGQGRVLNSLLSTARVSRLVEQEALDGAAAYRPLDFLADVRKGIWSEVYAGGAPLVDAYRRNLQRTYVDTLASRINGAQAATNDVRAFFRGELKLLDDDLRLALGARRMRPRACTSTTCAARSPARSTRPYRPRPPRARRPISPTRIGSIRPESRMRAGSIT